MEKSAQKTDAELIQAAAAQEHISPEGITILKGKVYINLTGIDTKIQNKCENDNLILKEIVKIDDLEKPTEKNGYLSGKYYMVSFFDRENYMKALAMIPNPAVESLDNLRKTFTYSFYGEGWASPESTKAIAWTWKTGNEKEYDPWGKELEVKVHDKLLLENVIMMAERRATNRAKREATGTGLTSVEEMSLDNLSTTEAEEEEAAGAPVDERTALIGRITETMKSVVFSDKDRAFVGKAVPDIKSLEGLRGLLKKQTGEKENREAQLKDEKQMEGK